MAHFNNNFINFFKDLEKNNNTEWFNENRKTYEQSVKKPFADLVQEMIARIQKYEPSVKIKPGDAIMRINRDIRFSKDKIPYNTHVAANISPFGKKDKSYPGFYFQVSARGVSIVGGAYVLEPAVLQKVRTYIANNLKEFAAVCNDKTFKERFGRLQGEQSKRLSPELQAAAEKEPLLANKQFYYSAELKSKEVVAGDLADTLTEYFLAGRKMNEFLRRALGRRA